MGSSWGRIFSGVKHTSARALDSRASRFSRHFKGWQLGALSLGLALTAAALAVPRQAPPDAVPLPEVDWSLQAERLQRQAEDRRKADHEPLPFDVRAVGEAARRYGSAAARNNETAIQSALAEWQRLTRLALERHPPELLARLRAVQTELFLEALSRWEKTGQADTDLVELGDQFLARARQNRWTNQAGTRLILSRAERANLFFMRWTHLSGLWNTRVLGPDLHDFRLYFFILLRLPERTASDPANGPATARRQLSYVAALARRDASYPALLARGILLYQLGEHGKARAHLRQHLIERPEGPWTLRARNHLLAAASQGGLEVP